jgi:hypothetical protein
MRYRAALSLERLAPVGNCFLDVVFQRGVVAVEIMRGSLPCQFPFGYTKVCVISPMVSLNANFTDSVSSFIDLH